MKLRDFELKIPLDCILNDQGPLKEWTAPGSELNWGDMTLNLTFSVTPKVCGELLKTKEFTLEFSYWCDDSSDPSPLNASASGPTLHAIQQTPEPEIYYIALKAEMADQVPYNHVLDYSYFHTHGYIPVYTTCRGASDALNEAYRRTVSERRMFRIRLAPGSNLYCRSDKYDKSKHKLFFPIPLASGDHTIDELMKRWEWYKSETRYPKRWTWEWQAANFNCLTVEEVSQCRVEGDGKLEGRVSFL